MTEISKYYENNTSVVIREPQPVELELLTDLMGKEAVDFILDSNSMYVEESVVKDVYSKLKFVLLIKGRILELNIREGNYLEIHFSLASEYSQNQSDKYDTTLQQDELGTSLSFLKFLDQVFSKVKKDIPLTILGASGKRGKLIEKNIKNHGLTNVEVGNLI